MMVCLIALLTLPLGALAQEEKEEAPEAYVYATYLRCDTGQLWRADEIIESVFKPVYDAAVEEGMISLWGWMGHHTGGEFRRLMVTVAPSIEALLDAQETLAKKVGEKNRMASMEAGKICGDHLDYIWKREAGPVVDVKRGPASFSVYQVCDMTKEARADEIVKEVFGPIYDRYVAEGKIASWGWMSHVVGGKYRRISTMSASDHKALLKARGEFIREISEKHEAAADEFSSICYSHQDYMWQDLLAKAEK
jgi:hypothetical protein